MHEWHGTNGKSTATLAFVPLSEREAELVHLLSEGLEPAHIAEQLRTTPEAIRADLVDLTRRLQARTSGEAGAG